MKRERGEIIEAQKVSLSDGILKSHLFISFRLFDALSCAECSLLKVVRDTQLQIVLVSTQNFPQIFSQTVIY